MIDPDVRPALPGDASQLDCLEAEGRELVAGQRGGDRWLETHPPRTGRWPEVLDAESVLVAHIGEVAVGYLVLRTDGPVASVEDVFVTPDARELGFGDALLEAAVELGRAAGCNRLEGESLPGDRETKNLYERAGIKARLITVSTVI